MMALSMDRAEKDMIAAAEYLPALDGVTGEHVGALGFCSGGGLAVWAVAASSLIGTTVSYYHLMPHGKPDFANITGPVLGHFGRDDEFVSLPDARPLETELSPAGVDTTFEVYERAGHALVNDTNRLGTYDPDVAARPWQCTVAFQRNHLSVTTG